MPDRPLVPAKPLGVWLMALLMTATVFSALLFENRQYLFATKLYENGDWAADSLLVRHAKHHLLLHGHYSRWHFYHPGPALVDTLAAGEALFHDALHLVPTPYNGQLIALCLAMTLAFSLALSICARRLGAAAGGGRFFLPLALLFAVLHYGNVGAPMFLDAWPAFPPITVFLCFLVAAAAVGSGGGGELGILVAAGGWLVHNSAAQPLFVVPLTLLAYAGLLAAARPSRAKRPAGSGAWRERLAAGWRAFPRSHVVAAVLLTLFILPVALDAAQGRDSNFARLLEHLRAHRHDPGKSWPESLGYLFTFGGGDTFQAGATDFRYSRPALLASLQLHRSAYLLWLTALLGAPALFLAARRWPGDPAETTGARERQSFVRWFYVTVAAAGFLTLLWGIKQDGPLYYYNAYFNYSIYFGLALGFAAALAVALMAWTSLPSRRGARPWLSGLLWSAAVAAVIARADRFQASTFGTPADAAMADTVRRAAATLPADAICYLDWNPSLGLKSTSAVALELARLGRKPRVSDNWEIMFGRWNTIQEERVAAPLPPLVRWLVVRQSDDPARLGRWPLLFDCGLDRKSLPTLNPAGERISFAADGNYHDFAVFGWATSGSAWSHSDSRTGLLAFRPLPLPPGAVDGVDLLVSAWTLSPPGQAEPQRVALVFNGAPLGTARLPVPGPGLLPLRVRISAAQWGDAVAKDEARLLFRFPDAVSPASLGLGTDYRLIGGGFRGIEFQPVPADAGRANSTHDLPTVPGSSTRPDPRPS